MAQPDSTAASTAEGVGDAFVRVRPAERLTPTMSLLDTLVEKVMMPLVATTWSTRHPQGQVDRNLACVVSDVRELTDDVHAITFARADGEPLPAWFPGAHVDVVLPSGRMRQYSLNGHRADRHHWRIAVRRIPLEAGGGGGSMEMHALRAGDRVTLKGPRDAFPFIFSPQGYLFVAGGIGITPILPMLRRTVRKNRVPWSLVYTGRTRDSMPFLDEIAEITQGFEERVHLWPDDEYGVPDGAKILSVAPPGAMLYTCGPMPMIDAIRAVIPAPQIESLHYERFAAPPVRGGEPFQLELARTGVTVDVAADESALTAVRSVLPGQAYSCQQGFCGTCKVRVLEGKIEHHDHALAPYERDGHMMLCVSRASAPRGRIVLDL